MKFVNIKIGKRLAIAFGTITVLTLVLLIVSYQAISNLSERWEQFHSVSLEKHVTALQGDVHLGDAIHNFKDYVLRGQDYDQKFLTAMAAIEQDTARYVKNHGDMNEREKSALGRIKEGAETYRAALAKAVEMKTAGAPIEEIDKAIQGADKAIGQAFDELQVEAEEETNVTSQSISRIASNSKWIIIFIGGFAVMLSALFAWLIARSVTRPLKEAIQVAEAVARGDLTQRIEVKAADETGQMLQALQAMNTSLLGIVGEVRNTTDSISTAAKEIASGNADLSQRTEEQASSLEETASSMEELTSTVKQNAENAKQANQLAANASDIAVKGGEVVGEVVQTMASISTSSKKIVDIISVIEGIAFQTNILALNAAVEAARAGEQGRGFAVVASEVRNLAQRSAAAAKEIKSLIDDSVDKVETGSKQVDQAGETMQEIVNAVKRVTDIMSEIAAASNEQSAGIEQVNQAIIQMDEVTQQNAALVEQAAAAAEAMQEQAGSLMEAVSIFKVEKGSAKSRETVTKTTLATHVPPPVPAQSPRKQQQLSKATEPKDGDWEEF